MSESCLRMSVGGLPPFSARDCQQILEPIEIAEVHRSVNGEMVTTVSRNHHKYKTTIRSQDKLPIAIDSLWIGQDVELGCIQRLWQKTDQNDLQLARPPVEGSVVALSQERQPIEVQQVQGQNVTLTSPGYVGYRPQLMMKIIDFGFETQEWGEGRTSWFLKLEEK
ncbi:MAG: hypothetical protein KBB83_04725 [Alphaproteobacteria bacterium]|nr:hypothetical protein [Alphaproteobacteria bacterium]